jgi:hypothetical protein
MAKHIRLRSCLPKGRLFQNLSRPWPAAAAAPWLLRFFLFEFEKPTLVLEKEIKYLGGRVELAAACHDRKSGIRSITITLKQGEKSEQLLEKPFPVKPGSSLPGRPP